MAGSVIITAANGSLAIPAVVHLLKTLPDHLAILTVRNASDKDPNTAALRAEISRFPQAKTVIHELDLSKLSAVRDFTKTVARNIDNGAYPRVKAIICNAFHWNLTSPEPILTSDGFEQSFQINHIAHATLVLRLLDHFDPAGARIVTLSTDAHWPGRNPLEKKAPEIPDNVDALATPPVESDYTGRPFQRYANSKLAAVMWTHALNRRLLAHSTLSKVNAVAMEPGSLTDSRALRTNTPSTLWYLQRFILQPFQPILCYINPTMRSVTEVGPVLMDLALQKSHPGERGHFDFRTKSDSSPASMDEKKQDLIWEKTLEWAGLTKGEIDALGL
ncbi:unnamed protein product [Periconia digitata]|uniref:Uncharacterized protein n=1 Tax=Periconia digitata TaxID=1303443 RepID=A0A9W4UDY3_9PLEO|nr:unnamed protein product [Periconia digitata]